MSDAALAATPAQERPRVGIVFAGLMLVLLLAALDNTIVATALPTIVTDLGGLEHLAWVTSAYLLAQTAVTPLYGKLGDLYGRKRVLQSAVLLFLGGSALCGAAASMDELIAFRAVQGLGAGGLICSRSRWSATSSLRASAGATRVCSARCSGSRAWPGRSWAG